MCKREQVLTIAGSDSGGGAGIQADLKTFQMRGVYGMSVITAITAQNTQGVFDIHYIPIEIIESQLCAIAKDFQPKAFKLGMLGNSQIIECVAQQLLQYSFGKMVLDPVMVAKGGALLLEYDAIAALKHYLLPLADVITPNIPEVEMLTGIKITNLSSIHQAAEKLFLLGTKNIIIKGGHWLNSKSEYCTDWIFTKEEHFSIDVLRYQTRHTHGTGCTFSACLAAELAKGNDLKSAVYLAKDFITMAIGSPLNIGKGHGPTNHWAYSDKKNRVEYEK